MTRALELGTRAISDAVYLGAGQPMVPAQLLGNIVRHLQAAANLLREAQGYVKTLPGSGARDRVLLRLWGNRD